MLKILFLISIIFLAGVSGFIFLQNNKFSALPTAVASFEFGSNPVSTAVTTVIWKEQIYENVKFKIPPGWAVKELELVGLKSVSLGTKDSNVFFSRLTGTQLGDCDKYLEKKYESAGYLKESGFKSEAEKRGFKVGSLFEGNAVFLNINSPVGILKELNLCFEKNGIDYNLEIHEVGAGREFKGLNDMVLMMNTMEFGPATVPTKYELKKNEATKSAETAIHENKILSDEDKQKLMGQVANAVDVYFNTLNKETKSPLGNLPDSLDQVDLNSLGADLDQNINKFLKEDLKYKAVTNYKYLLCAQFPKFISELPSAYFESKAARVEFPLEKPYQCFRLGVFSSSHLGASTQEIYKQIQQTKTLNDAKIDSVKHDAEKLAGVEYGDNYSDSKFVTFPNGFFSDNYNEYGLIDFGSKPELSISKPITLKIKFKEPVKLKSIRNFFTNCRHKDCYSWGAVGKTVNGSEVQLIKDVATGLDPDDEFVQQINSEDQFVELTLSAVRTYQTFENIFWKKIKLEYK